MRHIDKSINEFTEDKAWTCHLKTCMGCHKMVSYSSFTRILKIGSIRLKSICQRRWLSSDRSQAPGRYCREQWCRKIGRNICHRCLYWSHAITNHKIWLLSRRLHYFRVWGRQGCVHDLVYITLPPPSATSESIVEHEAVMAKELPVILKFWDGNVRREMVLHKAQSCRSMPTM